MLVYNRGIKRPVILLVNFDFNDAHKLHLTGRITKLMFEFAVRMLGITTRELLKSLEINSRPSLQMMSSVSRPQTG
ncbi:hypothetical protein TNCV_120071 [Trichonephila clavipes]|nr:hypothetical protein TNCV_120071 [Trichonephila clavipes]